jgi:hypothetical protein
MSRVIALLLCATAATAAVAAPGERQAVLLPLVSVAINETERTALEEGLRGRTSRFGVVPLGRDETIAILQDVASLGLSCDYGALECLVRVGALGAADLVVAGSIGRSSSGGGLDLELLVVDVAAMAEVARERVPLGALTSRELDLDSALCAVLAPERWRGTLLVTAKQRGASIVVDGVPRGFTPLPRPISLRPGRHELYVGLEGFRAHTEVVDVPYGGGVERKVKLQAGVSTPPPGFSAPVATSTPTVPAPTTLVADGSSSAERRRPLRVAVYDVDVAGVEPRVGRLMGQLLLAEIKKRERISVIGADEIRTLIAGPPTPAPGAPADPELGVGLAGCSTEECFADIAEALGADAVVVAQLTALEGELLFGVRRIDQARQEVSGSVLERVPGSEPVALLALVGPAVEKLFPDAPLRAGETAGVDDAARRRLAPPPLPPAVPLALGGTAGIAGVVAVAAFASSLVAWSNYSQLIAIASGTGGVIVDARQVQGAARTATTSAIVGWSAVGVTAAFGTAAGIAVPFTNWDGAEGVGEQP